MKRAMKNFFWIMAFLFLQTYQAQTGKEIIEKNIELSGGLLNWKLLNTVLIQGKVSLGLNEVYPVKIHQARPNLTKTSIVIKNKETPIDGYDGKKGYAFFSATNKLQEYKEYTPESFDNDFIDFENKGFVAKFLGTETIENVLCNKIELTKNVNKTIYWFDAKTYMLIKEEKKDETLIYKDYKKVGNLLFPFHIESTSIKKDSDYVLIINKIDLNKEFANSTFKF